MSLHVGSAECWHGQEPLDGRLVDGQVSRPEEKSSDDSGPDLPFIKRVI